MSTKPSQGRVRSVYEFIKANRRTYSVRFMCRVLAIAPSGYYAWLAQPVSNRAREDARLLRLRRSAHARERIRALHRYRTRRWSVGKPSVLSSKLLQRQFTVTKRNKAWVTNITYIRTWQGWLYLTVVMDLFSRKIVGWSAGPTIRRELVLDAVMMAVRRRRPRGTVIHSDQGTQYGSDAGDGSVGRIASSRA